MSDQNIKVGDNVIIELPIPCCGYEGGIGKVFSVNRIDFLPAVCSFCATCHSALSQALLDGKHWIAINRLRKLPPLFEPEGTETQEEISA